MQYSIPSPSSESDLLYKTILGHRSTKASVYAVPDSFGRSLANAGGDSPCGLHRTMPVPSSSAIPDVEFSRGLPSCWAGFSHFG